MPSSSGCRSARASSPSSRYLEVGLARRRRRQSTVSQAAAIMRTLRTDIGGMLLVSPRLQVGREQHGVLVPLVRARARGSGSRGCRRTRRRPGARACAPAVAPRRGRVAGRVPSRAARRRLGLELDRVELARRLVGLGPWSLPATTVGRPIYATPSQVNSSSICAASLPVESCSGGVTVLSVPEYVSGSPPRAPDGSSGV